MSTTKRVAVLLSGSGVFDGSELHEAVVTLLTLARAGAAYQCTAPDKEQLHVVNHKSGEITDEKRNVLVEAARIARGDIIPITQLDPSQFDAIFLPGGFGAAKNLNNFAIAGAACTIDDDVQRVLEQFHAAGKPIGAVCIAPTVVVRALHKGDVTIGADPDAASGIESMGGVHHVCPVTEMHVDTVNKIVTAPAYMYDAPIQDVATGIEKAVHATLELA